MKILNLNQFNEKMKIVPLSDEDFSKIPDNFYKYHPETKEGLTSIIYERIQKDGKECNLNDIDVSKITDMSYLFAKHDNPVRNSISNFNGDISGWNVSNVTNMSSMFSGAESFNQDIGGWNVSNVKYMNGMFKNAKSFNSDLSGWDVTNVEDMKFMFCGAESFNRNLSKWNVSNVRSMSYMFKFAGSFDCDISRWDISKVESMIEMFCYARSFKRDLSGWDVSSVQYATDMFDGCPLFNQPEKQPKFNI